MYQTADMRTYSISPMSSAPGSAYHSPMSSRPASPSSAPSQQYPTYADVQATPRPSVLMPTSFHPSLPIPTGTSNVTGHRDAFNFPAQPQHWDVMQRQMPSGMETTMVPSMRSTPGEEYPSMSVPISDVPYVPPGHNHRPSLFAHHTSSGIGRAGSTESLYGRRKVAQFVHIPAEMLQAPLPKLRATQACEACRKRKVKCSGDKPTCARCLHRSINCEYAIINETLRLQSRRAKMAEKAAAAAAMDMHLSSTERARMTRRHTRQGSVINIGGQMYMEVEQVPIMDTGARGNGRPEFVKYATEGGQVYGVEMGSMGGPTEMDVDMPMTMDTKMSIRSGSSSGSGSGSPPQILFSQADSERQLRQRTQSEPGFVHHPGYQGGMQGQGETELVVVEIPRRARGHSLLDLLNPVSVHPLAMFNGGGNNGMGEGFSGMQVRRDVEFPATNPVIPPSSLPVMLDPTLSSGSARLSPPHSRYSSASPPALAPSVTRTSSTPSSNIPPSNTSASVLPLSSSPSPARPHSRSSSTAPSDAESSMSVGVGRTATGDLDMGWMETVRCVSRRGSVSGEWASDEEGEEVDYDAEERNERSFSFAIPSATSSTVSVSALSELTAVSLAGTAMYRSLSTASTDSNASEYSAGFSSVPLSRTSSASSTSAEPGTPVTPMYLSGIGDDTDGEQDRTRGENEGLTRELQDMFSRILGDEDLADTTAEESSNSTPSPQLEGFTAGADASSGDSGPGSGSSSETTHKTHSLIPRPITTRRSKPGLPSRSSRPAQTVRQAGSSDSSVTLSPPLSSSDFSLSEADASLLDEVFNFDEFALPADGPAEEFNVEDVIERRASPAATTTTTTEAATGTGGAETDTTSPTVPETSTSSLCYDTATDADASNKTLMEEVLSFVASGAASGGLSSSTSCAAEVGQAGLRLGLSGSLGSIGSLGDVVMASPVLVQ